MQLTRRDILDLGNANHYLNTCMNLQRQQPEVAEKNGINIILSNKALYRIGRNQDKIKSAYEAIAKFEKEILEKLDGKIENGRFLFKKGKEYAPDEKKQQQFTDEFGTFLDDPDCKEEFDLMTLDESMFDEGTGLDWNSFFRAYDKLIIST